MKKHTYVSRDKYDILKEPEVDIKPTRGHSFLVILSGICFYSTIVPMLYLATTIV